VKAGIGVFTGGKVCMMNGGDSARHICISVENFIFVRPELMTGFLLFSVNKKIFRNLMFTWK
jgi:hypothetical protein